MASLGLMQYRSAAELRDDELQEAQRLADAEARRTAVFESSLASHIRRSWEEAKMAKQEVEQRLLDCLRRRKGEYDPSKLSAIKGEGGSAIYMMLTATKCRAAASWVRDILMPASEKPWGLSPTPIADLPPEFVQPVFQQFMQRALMEAQQSGEQPDPQQLMTAAEAHIRHAVQEKAQEAAERHEELIADQLAEGEWDDALEAFIDDFATYPAAFIRGHNLRRVSALAWQAGWKAVKTKEIKPEWYRVSPFDMYPSPDATSIDDGAYIIERARMTRAHLNKLIGVPSYNADAIREVLSEHGQTGLRDWLWTDGERAELEGRGHEWLTRGQTIDALIYCGGAQGTSLLQWGVDPSEVDDPLAEYEVEATLIGQHVIRVKFNRDPLERRPYHKASFQPIPGSFWGMGIPELMADIQDVCNATARSLVNNLAISSGPQVEVYEDRLDPTEDPTEMYPWKVWRTKDSNVTGNNPAVRFYQPTSNAAELLAVYEKFEIRADDATNIPRYTYGNERVGGAGSTATGLSMLMESANKGIKDAIRHIDRGVIRRVIEALWLHNMQYSDDQSIKGDVSVIPRGSSAMLIREQTHQMRSQFLQMTANPIDMGIIGQEGRRKLLASIAEKLDLPGAIPSEDEMEKNMAAQNETGQMMQELDRIIKQAEAQEKSAEAEKAMAEVDETRAEAQRTQTLTPLEARKMLAEILNMMQGGQHERARLESAGPNRQHAGWPAPANPAATAPRGMPGQAGNGGQPAGYGPPAGPRGGV
ncbi:hypothetical protein [Marinobacter sp. MDS2]|uniref:portal protein n=1 Tax=Marinobacter sp. MDS2 TaxID=3065961 RepID=UPI00273A8473|nr:hypothetical protein [Marinobacter sp. MDS2]MDP4546491.1 hypothetical protein [Marinobacter sp. MDS2]